MIFKTASEFEFNYSQGAASFSNNLARKSTNRQLYWLTSKSCRARRYFVQDWEHPRSGGRPATTMMKVSGFDLMKKRNTRKKGATENRKKRKHAGAYIIWFAVRVNPAKLTDEAAYHVIVKVWTFTACSAKLTQIELSRTRIGGDELICFNFRVWCVVFWFDSLSCCVHL